MLDIKFIRENQDLVKDAIRKKFVKLNLDDLITLDDKRRETLTLVESLRAEQKKISDKMPTLSNPIEREQLIADIRPLKEHLTQKEEELKTLMVDWQKLMLEVPNVPDFSVPEGNSDADNQEFKSWGEIKNFDFESKDHVELMTKLKMVDFERGTKVHGFRGYFLVGDGAMLCFAIWRYALDFFTKKNFSLVLPPVIVRKQNLYITGHLPGDAEDYYLTQDGDALAGTAEVPIMGMHAEEVFASTDLPKRYLGFSPCFRREAGSYSKEL